jgi:hypothetical protein
MPKMNAQPRLKSLFPWQGEISEGQKSGRTHPYLVSLLSSEEIFTGVILDSALYCG